MTQCKQEFDAHKKKERRKEEKRDGVPKLLQVPCTHLVEQPVDFLTTEQTAAKLCCYRNILIYLQSTFLGTKPWVLWVICLNTRSSSFDSTQTACKQSLQTNWRPITCQEIRLRLAADRKQTLIT